MSTWRRLLGFVQPHWREVILAVGLGVLTIGSGIALMSISAFLISAAALAPSVAELEVAIVGVRFFGISRGVFRYLERLASHKVTLNLLADLRVWFYRSVEPLAPAGLEKAHSGDLLARAVSDIDTLKDFFVRVVAPPLVAVLVALSFGFFLSFFSPALAWAAIGGLLFVGAALPLSVHWLSRGAEQTLVRMRAQLTRALIDGAQGLADLLANNAAGRQQEAIAELGATTARNETRLAWIGGVHSGLSVFGANITAWLVLLLAIPMVNSGQFSGVMLAVVTLGTLAAFEAVQPFAQAAQMLQGQLTSAGRLFEITDAAPMVAAPVHPLPVFGSTQPPALSIRKLSFAYPEGPQILRELSLELAPGRRVAILGPSGSGKSTLLNLLLRFWDFDYGEISLDGNDIRQLDAEWVRNQFAVVSQQVHIFNATLEDNLRLAAPLASLAELEAVARQANLLDFIESQADGWQTWAGEHGLRLSGGERQRLGVARTLLRRAPILLLDEFTAHLDAITAQAVLAETLAAANGRSILLITHQSQGLDDFDAIYQMEDGTLSNYSSPPRN